VTILEYLDNNDWVTAVLLILAFMIVFCVWDLFTKERKADGKG